jgi:hypothetical protein
MSDNMNKEKCIKDELKKSSKDFRSCSSCDRAKTESKYESVFGAAHQLSQSHGLNFNEAMTRISPSWKKDKWATVVPEVEDSKVGDVITTKSLFVCCNSILNGMYNDTIGVFIDKITDSHVTYSKKLSSNMIHSGDMNITYGLRHEITLSPSNLDGKVGYIVSSPWVSGRSRPITELATTCPIFEICTEDDGVLKRYIIPQDFSEGGNNTACVNAEITFNDGMWKITLKRDFIGGFASDMFALVLNLRHMANVDKFVNTPSVNMDQPGIPSFHPNKKQKLY